MKITHYKPEGCAFLIGALLPLAFAPFVHFSWLAFFLPVGLWLLLEQTTSKKAFLIGESFGLGFFGFGISWVLVSFEFTEIPAPLALLLTGLFILVLSLFFAVQAFIYQKLTSHRSQSDVKKALIFSCLWILFEGARTYFLTGFPWLFLGYSQTDASLGDLAPLIGVYGISLLTLLMGFALCALGIPRHRLKAGMLLAVLMSGSFLCKQIAWTQTLPHPFSVTLVQANIPQTLKWTPEFAAQNLEQQVFLSDIAPPSSLLVWPETAFPYLLPHSTPFLEQLQKILPHAGLLTGTMTEKTPVFYNSLTLITPEGTQTYHKRHLVPFGEYLPFQTYLGPLLEKLKFPAPLITGGPPTQPPLHFLGIDLSPLICYEIAYPQLVLESAKNGHILVGVSNDSWFGYSLGPAQHFQMARMRARETGRFLIRGTNNGISGVVNPQGNVQAIANHYEPALLTTSVSPMIGSTPLMIIGHHAILGAILLLLAVCLFL